MQSSTNPNKNKKIIKKTVKTKTNNLKNKNTFSNIKKTQYKNKKTYTGNNKFMLSMQKFGKGIADVTYSIWKAIAKFFSDSYAYLAKQFNKLANSKTMRELNKTWD
jgi:hypothetical protein